MHSQNLQEKTLLRRRGDHLELILPERLNVQNVSLLLNQLKQDLRFQSYKTITADLGKVTAFDDYGALILMEIKKQSSRHGVSFKLANIPSQVQQFLDLIGFASLDEGFCAVPRKTTPSIILRTGEAALQILADFKELLVFIGETILCFFRLLAHPKRLRVNDLLMTMSRVGVDALPIVTLLSFLLGLILAFMSAVQLQQFGADIYVASLVSMAVVRELGPIMTSILVAGRSGSAFAAEIGTMKISEEIDALNTMGLDPTLLLAMPKVLAAIIVLPLLVIFADIFAISGGLLVGTTMLNLSVKGYIQESIQVLTLFDFTWSLFKSAIFGLLIAWIGCFRGFLTQGGSAEVGRSTTSAVVNGIFFIILADSLLVVLVHYWS